MDWLKQWLFRLAYGFQREIKKEEDSKEHDVKEGCIVTTKATWFKYTTVPPHSIYAHHIPLSFKKKKTVADEIVDDDAFVGGDRVE